MPRVPAVVAVDPALHAEVSRVYQALRGCLLADPHPELRAASVLVALEALTIAVLTSALQEDPQAGTVLAMAQVESFAELVSLLLAEAQLTADEAGTVH